MPAEYVLTQNYPNPFNPSTTIEYTVPKAGGQPASGDRLAAGDRPAVGERVGRVRLAVYDLLGREVALIVDEEQRPGRYSVRFDAGPLSSGVYFYRLTAGALVLTRKMTLVR